MDSDENAHQYADEVMFVSLKPDFRSRVAAQSKSVTVVNKLLTSCASDCQVALSTTEPARFVALCCPATYQHCLHSLID
jgi:hypothetical protein